VLEVEKSRSRGVESPELRVKNREVLNSSTFDSRLFDYTVTSGLVSFGVRMHLRSTQGNESHRWRHPRAKLALSLPNGRGPGSPEKAGLLPAAGNGCGLRPLERFDGGYCDRFVKRQQPGQDWKEFNPCEGRPLTSPSRSGRRPHPNPRIARVFPARLWPTGRLYQGRAIPDGVGRPRPHRRGHPEG